MKNPPNPTRRPAATLAGVPQAASSRREQLSQGYLRAWYSICTRNFPFKTCQKCDFKVKISTIFWPIFSPHNTAIHFLGGTQHPFSISEGLSKMRRISTHQKSRSKIRSKWNFDTQKPLRKIGRFCKMLNVWDMWQKVNGPIIFSPTIFGGWTSYTTGENEKGEHFSTTVVANDLV